MVGLERGLGGVLGADLGGGNSEFTTAVRLEVRLGGRLRNRISDSTTAVALERRLGASWELTWGYVDSTTAVGLEERFGGVFGCRLGGS